VQRQSDAATRRAVHCQVIFAHHLAAGLIHISAIPRSYAAIIFALFSLPMPCGAHADGVARRARYEVLQGCRGQQRVWKPRHRRGASRCRRSVSSPQAVTTAQTASRRHSCASSCPMLNPGLPLYEGSASRFSACEAVRCVLSPRLRRQPTPRRPTFALPLMVYGADCRRLR